jgi:hypothetical protein
VREDLVSLNSNIDVITCSGADQRQLGLSALRSKPLKPYHEASCSDEGRKTLPRVCPRLSRSASSQVRTGSYHGHNIQSAVSR